VTVSTALAWCLGTAVLLAGSVPRSGPCPLRGRPAGRTASHHRRKEPTAAAWRSARGVPQAGFASGSVPASVGWVCATRPILPGRAQSTPSLQSVARPWPRFARHVSKGNPLLDHRARRPGERKRKAPTHPKARPPFDVWVVFRTCPDFRDAPSHSAARLMVPAAARRQGSRRFRGLRRPSQRLSPCDCAPGRPPIRASVPRSGSSRKVEPYQPSPPLTLWA
jgi:hypothetical protein